MFEDMRPFLTLQIIFDYHMKQVGRYCSLFNENNGVIPSYLIFVTLLSIYHFEDLIYLRAYASNGLDCRY